MEALKRICLLLVIIFVITGCGLSDWSYELVGGYAITHCNSQDIRLSKHTDMDGFYSIVIPNFRVEEFRFNDRYIGLRTIRYNGMRTEEQKIGIGIQAYFLVDTFSDQICGPFVNRAAFEAQCLEWDTGDMGIWRSTDKEPV